MSRYIWEYNSFFLAKQQVFKKKTTRGCGLWRGGRSMAVGPASTREWKGLLDSADGHAGVDAVGDRGAVRSPVHYLQLTTGQQF